MDRYKSQYLFWGACLPLRTATALLIPNKYIAPFSFLLGIGLLVLFLTNSRLNAFEGGNQTWWAPYRILHALLFLSATSLACNSQYTAARGMLLLDVALGSCVWLRNKKINQD